MTYPEIDWVQLAVEAPLTVLFMLFVIKCYRARVHLRLTSPCLSRFGFALKVDFPGGRSASDSSEEVPEVHRSRREDLVPQSASRLRGEECDFPSAVPCCEERAIDVDWTESKGAAT